MQTAKQLSVRLVNKPGRLADMLGALAKEKVSFRALTVMDSGERGTVRFVPDELETATAVLGRHELALRVGRRVVGRRAQPGRRLPKNLRETGRGTP